MSKYTTTIDWLNPAHTLIISLIFIAVIAGTSAVDSAPALEVPMGLVLMVAILLVIISIIRLVAQSV